MFQNSRVIVQEHKLLNWCAHGVFFISLRQLPEEASFFHIVGVAGSHLLRECARPAEDPLSVIHNRSGEPADSIPWELESFPHLDPPEPAVEQPEHAQHSAGDPDRVADHVVVYVERRDVEDPERSEAEHQKSGDVHVHVPHAEPLHVPAEHAAGAEEGEAADGGVVSAIEQRAVPLWILLRNSLIEQLEALLRGLVALRGGCAAAVPSERTANRVQSCENRRGDPQREERSLESFGTRFGGVAPVEAAQGVLREASEVEEEEEDEHVEPFAGTVGAVLAVNFPELHHVLGAPSTEHEQVVEEVRVLVEAHEGEERVEELVVDLDPVVAEGLGGENAVEQAEEEAAEHGDGGGDAEQPEEERDVQWVLQPFLAGPQ